MLPCSRFQFRASDSGGFPGEKYTGAREPDVGGLLGVLALAAEAPAPSMLRSCLVAEEP